MRLFDFNFVNSDDMSKIITSSDSTKKSNDVIPKKIVKLANKEIRMGLANCINESFKKKEFPNEMKTADVTPIFKKEDPLNKENYRPLSVFPTVSEIFDEYYLINLKNFPIIF